MRAPQRVQPGSGANLTNLAVSTYLLRSAYRKQHRRTSRQDVLSPLNLPLVEPSPPLFGRSHYAHRIKPLGGGAFDDEASYNTQASSQWDGFRHFRDPITQQFYNGIVIDEIITEENLDKGGPQQSRKLGIDAWARRGIAGRGVLLDVYRWSQTLARNRYDPFTEHHITVADFQACAESQGVNFRTGDILLIRMGWLHRYNSLTIEQKNDGITWDTMNHKCAGLESSEEMKDFLHDFYFAAAAADNPSLEAWPPESSVGSLHASMLPLWGMPIGELWDLEALSQKCQQEKRWTFLVTSAPVNVPGGVASPPNALALF